LIRYNLNTKVEKMNKALLRRVAAELVGIDESGPFNRASLDRGDMG
jgi:hypothetical protein